MKRFMPIIFFTLIVHSVLGMEEQQTNITESIFNKLIPELQIYTIGQGINARLNSNPDPIEAIIDTWKYVSNITSTNTFWHSKQKELITELKNLAIEKFAPEYFDPIKKELKISIQELNEKLKNLMLTIFAAITQNKKFDNERNEIIKLIIAGVHPHIKVTLPHQMPQINVDKKILKSCRPKLSLFELLAISQDFNMLRLLLIYDGNIDFKTKGCSILIGSARRGRSNDMINFLLKKGANIELRDKNGETALSKATLCQNILAVQILLNHGAKVDEDVLNSAQNLLSSSMARSEHLNRILRARGLPEPDFTDLRQIIELLKAAKNKSDNKSRTN